MEPTPTPASAAPSANAPASSTPPLETSPAAGGIAADISRPGSPAPSTMAGDKRFLGVTARPEAPKPSTDPDAAAPMAKPRLGIQATRQVRTIQGLPGIAGLSLAKDLAERHAKLVKRIAAVEDKREDLEAERKKLLYSIAMEYDLKKARRVREAREEILMTLQEELTARGDVKTWLADYGPAAETLRDKAAETLKGVQKQVAEKLGTIGYTEEAIAAAYGGRNAAKGYLTQLVSLHPETVKAQARLKQLSVTCHLLLNAFIENSPCLINDQRMQAIRAELQEAVRQNESGLSVM